MCARGSGRGESERKSKSGAESEAEREREGDSKGGLRLCDIQSGQALTNTQALDLDCQGWLAGWRQTWGKERGQGVGHGKCDEGGKRGHSPYRFLFWDGTGECKGGRSVCGLARMCVPEREMFVLLRGRRLQCGRRYKIEMGKREKGDRDVGAKDAQRQAQWGEKAAHG